MSKRLPDIVPVGDCGFCVRFEPRLTDSIHRQVVALTRLLQSKPICGQTDCVPAYASVTVLFHPEQMEHEHAYLLLRQRCDEAEESVSMEPRVVDVPVSYGGTDGPDLSWVTFTVGRPADEVVALHTAPLYRVDFIGFCPGFPYLSGLDPILHVSRKDTPRRLVPRGSVAIAGSQAGIYPHATAGGWQVIGRTPLSLFDDRADPPNRLQVGDRVRFIAVNVNVDECAEPISD